MKAEEYLKQIIDNIVQDMRIISFNKDHKDIDLQLITSPSDDLKELHMELSINYILHNGSVINQKYAKMIYPMNDWTDKSMDRAFIAYTSNLLRWCIFGKGDYKMSDLLMGRVKLVDHDNKTIKEIIDERSKQSTASQDN